MDVFTVERFLQRALAILIVGAWLTGHWAHRAIRKALHG